MHSRSQPHHSAQHQVPHLEIEDKILSIGPLDLTLRQAGILLIGGYVAFNIWKACHGLTELGTPGLVVRLLLGMIPVLVALAFAFGRIMGRSYDVWITLIWRYLWQPRVYVWRHLPPLSHAQEDFSLPSTLPESEE